MAQNTARQLEAVPKRQEQATPIHKASPKVKVLVYHFQDLKL